MRLEGLRSTALLRRALAGVVAVDLISFPMFLGDERTRALAEGVAFSSFAEIVSRPAVSQLLIAIGVLAAAVFGWRSGRVVAGFLSLIMLALLSTAHAELFGSPWRHLYYSGLCLAGWLVGLVMSRWRGLAEDESYAVVGSTALLGAAYLNGGISKLVFGGFDWAFGLPIQAIVVAQDGMVADGLVSSYRSWIVATPVIAGLFSFATIALELGAPLMLAGGAIRVVVALGLLAMHLNILVLTHILYWEAMVFLVLFGLLPRPAVLEAATEPSPLFLGGRPFAMSAVLLVACALIGINHQSRRFASWYDTGAATGRTSGTPAPLPDTPAEPKADVAAEPPRGSDSSEPPSVTPLQQIGPFAVGQTLAAGWSIDALELIDDGFIAMVSGAPGRVRFEVSCSTSPHRSPFDLGATHIFFSTGVAFKDLEAAGLALRRQLQNAGEGQALCDRLTDWQMAAQAGQLH